MRCSRYRVGRVLSLAFCVWTVVAAVVLAEPAQEGTFREADARAESPYSSSSAGPGEKVFWEHQIIQSNTKFLRVHFASISDSSSEPYKIVIRNFRGDIVESYSKSDFGLGSNMSSKLIMGDTADIQVLAVNPPSGLAFTIHGYSYQSKGAISDSVFAPDQRQPVSDYSSDNRITTASKAIAKLSYEVRNVPFSCTGFMISDDLMITNQHCINNQELCKTAIAIFGYEIMPGGSLRNGEQFRCSIFVIADEQLDFAVLKIDGAPGVAEKWGHLQLIDRELKEEELYLIGHPAGEPKQVSKLDCKVHTIIADGRGRNTDFGHLCDTLGGSSGSPVFDLDLNVVGLHHLGFSSGRWAQENRAVRITNIIPKLPH